MQTLLLDLKFAFRQLLKNPGFTAVAVLTLALGIGANTAIFSVVNGVLLKALPYPEPDRIFQVMRRFPFGNAEAISATKFSFFQQHNRAFEHLAACDFNGAGFNLLAGDEPEQVSGLRVSAGFFPVLGVKPMLGRTFADEEDRPGGGRVTVISHALWKRAFGGDQRIIGRAISLSGESYTVVGVMPPGFQTKPAADAWTPLRAVFNPQDKANMFLAFGRAKPGVTQEQAEADMTRVLALMREDHAGLVDDQEMAAVAKYQDQLIGDTKRPLFLLFGAVGFVLLIACANVANLLLSRAAARSKEISVRAALGAGRLRLIRQLLTESLLLAGTGAIVGLVLAHLGLNGLLALIPDSLPRMSAIGIDLPVLGFTLCVALAAGVLFGLAPAVDTGRLNLVDALREGSGRTTGAVPRGRLRNLLVASEVALSVVLLIGAALLIRTFANLRNENLGFDPHHVLTLKLSLNDPRYSTTAATRNFFRQMFERIEQLPGVEAAAYVTSLPLELGPDLPFDIEGRQQNASGGANYRHTTPNYFRAMSIPLRQGRSFAETDGENSPGVVIINEAFARQFFANENPIGQRLTVGRVMGPEWADRTREIVGVVGDVREQSVSERASPTMFMPLAQIPDPITRISNKIGPASCVVKMKSNPLSLSAAVRTAVRSADSKQSISNLRTMEQVLSWSIARQRFNMLLLAIFAGVALLLSAVGIYGVMSYSVLQRTREIGIRMALGAQASEVFRTVLRQGAVVTLCGLTIGLGAAFGLTKLLSSLLYRVSPADPLTFAIIPFVLAMVALLACWLPARRAAKVDPMVALRYE